MGQLSIHIDEALNLLDAQSRDVIIEHYLENRSTREIARRKGLSQATVSRKASAALQSLRQNLRVPGLVVTPAVMSSMFAENSAQAVPVSGVQAMGKMAVAGHQANLGLIAKASCVVGGLNLLPKVALTAALVTIVALPFINCLAGDEVDQKKQELLSLIDAYRLQIRDIDFSYSFVSHKLASDPRDEGTDFIPGMDLRIKIKDRMRYTAQNSRRSNLHISSYNGEVTYKYHKETRSGSIQPERSVGTTMHNYIYAAMMWPTIKPPREVAWLDIKVLLRSDETKVLRDPEELFGTSTVVLDYYSGNIKVWLDIEHGGIVRKAELRGGAGGIMSQRFLILELYNIDGIYFPAKATWEIFASSDAPEEMHNTPVRRDTMEVSQDDLRINSGLTEKDFIIDFPPGTRVFDLVSGENYTK